MISFLSRRIIENPQVGRQLGAKLHPFTIAAVLLIATGVLAATGIAAFASYRAGGPYDSRAPLGVWLHFWNAAATWGILAIILPFNAVGGGVDRLRADKVFDQIVVTGWSPLQLHFGNWAIGMMVALAIIIASLPFQTFAWSLGGVPPECMISTYGILLLHAGLITLIAQGLSMYHPDIAAGVLTLVGLFVTANLSLTTVSGSLGELVPLPFLARRHFSAETGGMPAGVGASHRLYGWSIPADIYAVLCWGLMAFPAIVILALGPYQRFTPGLDNFGNVVLPGIWNSRVFFRARQQLARRVDLAFFYENRPRRLDPWDFALRRIPAFAVLAFAWGLITALCLRGGVLQLDRRLARNDEGLTLLMGTVAAAFIALLALGDTRRTRGFRERVGPFTAPRGALLFICACLILGGFMALHAWVLLEASSGSPPPAPQGVAEYREAVRAFVLFLGTTYLLGKLASRGAVLLLSGIILVAPLILLTGIHEGWCPPEAFPAVCASPLVAIVATSSQFVALAKELGHDAESIPRLNTWIHAALMAGVILVLARGWFSRRGRTAPRGGRRDAVAASLVAGALLLAACGPASAEEPPLEAELIRGFEGRVPAAQGGRSFFREFWTIVLRNRGSAAIAGTLRAESGDGTAGPRRPFEVPPGTSTVVRWSDVVPGHLWASEIVLEGSGSRWERRIPQPESRVYSPEGSSEESRRAYLLVSDDRRLPSTVARTHDWIPARPLVLPEAGDAYSGLTAVLLAGSDLSRWTRGQRDALYDYLRDGGSVIFTGAIDRASLDGAGPWKDLLAPAESRRVLRGASEIVVGTLDEGRAAWKLPADAAGPEMSLLHWRRIGPGTIGRLGFDPRDIPPGLVEELGGEGALWKAFDDQLPASLGPLPFQLQLLASRPLPRDPAGFTPVLYYFGAYLFVVGPMLAILFRKKPRRKWLPLYLCGVPLIFSVGIPFLHASFELRPSLGVVVRDVHFGAGAKRGVARAAVIVRSSGRQRHRIEARGRGIVHHVTHAEGGFQEVFRHEEDPARIVFSTPPWGEANLVIKADASREHAIEGTVTLYRSTNRIRIRATGLPPPPAGSQTKLLLPTKSGGGMNWILVPGDDRAEGEIDHTSESRASIVSEEKQPPLRAILAVEVEDVDLPVESGDIAFGGRSRALIFQELELEIR